MKPTSKYAIVLTTAPGLRVARRLAKAALRARLIACANLVGGVESHYWWQEKLESGVEVLLVMKTTSPRLAALEKLILAEHPYDTPEFLVLRVTAGNARYLSWLKDSVRPRP